MIDRIYELEHLSVYVFKTYTVYFVLKFIISIKNTGWVNYINNYNKKSGWCEKVHMWDNKWPFYCTFLFGILHLTNCNYIYVWMVENIFEIIILQKKEKN